MNTPHLLICVEKPKEQPGSPPSASNSEWARWYRFLEAIEKTPKPAETVKRPVENVWLIAITSNILFATLILSLASSQGISFETYYLEDGPRKCS